MGISSIDELNEGDEKEEDMVDASEAKTINYFGVVCFLLMGIFIWTMMGVTIGKIARDITNHWFFKYPVYFFMYFIFLRFPFGVGNKMVKRSYDFTSFPEKIVFAFVMITSYILSLNFYEQLPAFLTWHLVFLN